MAKDWSKSEVEIIVSDYFQMLALEIRGDAYNKAEHRRAILPFLKNRSEASIEFKHQNISAVLAKMGLPYISGYKPAWNYQRLLEEAVTSYLGSNLQMEKSFELFAYFSPTISTSDLIFENLLEVPPERQTLFQEPDMIYRSPVKVNYLEVEQANRLTGTSGEKIVMEYEKWRLLREGKDSLADRIEWVSQTQGDGLGFDILSKNTNGSDRYIEVKATKLTKEAPIFFTKNEYDFSLANKNNYFLYRVFNLKQSPKLFMVGGAFDDFCNYQAVKFKGYF